MAEPIGSSPAPQSYDFQRLQRIVALVNEEASPFKTVDSAAIGAKPAMVENNDFIVMKNPEGELFQSTPVATQEVAKELEARGMAVSAHLDSIGAVAVKVDAGQAEELKKEGFLVYDNRPRNLIPDFQAVSLPEGTQMPKVEPLELTRTAAVQAQGFTGKGQVVAVIDSGFSHPGFNLLAYKDIVDGGSKQSDPVGHGTHVTGDVLQMAPNAQIVGVRVMNEEGQGRPSDIIQGIQWAVTNKERYNIGVINMSLGAGPQGIPSSENPIDRAVQQAIKKGITVISAAGNSGPDARTIGAPADEPLGIAVGSGLNRTKVSDFSSRGPTDDDLSKPDVMAPGEFISSWTVPGSQMDQMGRVVDKLRKMPDSDLVKLLKAKPQLIEALGLPDDILKRTSEDRQAILHKTLPPIYMPDNDHIAAPGTSFAAPIVAGIVADLKEANPKMGPQKVKEVLMKTADKMDPKFGPDDQGAGFVNAEKALEATREA